MCSFTILYIHIYIYTQHIPIATLSQSRMRQCSFRTIRMLLDRADTLYSVFLSKEEAKNIVQRTTGKKVRELSLVLPEHKPRYIAINIICSMLLFR